MAKIVTGNSRDLFEYLDYRKYILDWISSQPKKGRGARAAISKALRSPLSHVSQVLSGKTELTLEQAEEANGFFAHSVSEAEYFLLLVQLARAGTTKLRTRLESQIQKIQEKRLVLKERLDVKETISSEHQALFYSSWYYAAIHVLLTIEKFQTKEAISRYLNLSPQKVSEALDFLVQLGLAKQEGSRFVAGVSRIHLGVDSPMLSKHHTNWRVQTIQSLERSDALDALHYSSVVTISKKDVKEIKSLLVKAIENAKVIIRDSKEEELHSFCLDFYKVGTSN